MLGRHPYRKPHRYHPSNPLNTGPLFYRPPSQEVTREDSFFDDRIIFRRRTNARPNSTIE